MESPISGPQFSFSERGRATRETFLRYVQTRDVTLRDELFRQWQSLLPRIVRRFIRRGQSTEDLMQVASMGLVHAIERFDPARGVEFVSFATPTIIGELKRYYRDAVFLVKVPRSIQEVAVRVRAMILEMLQKLGRSPTVAELSSALSLSEEEILEALESQGAHQVVSLDTAMTSDEPGAPTPIDMLAAEDIQEILADRMDLAAGINKLPRKERLLIQLRFVKGLSQMQIAARMGISQMHVSRLLHKALRELRNRLTP